MKLNCVLVLRSLMPKRVPDSMEYFVEKGIRKLSPPKFCGNRYAGLVPNPIVPVHPRTGEIQHRNMAVEDLEALGSLHRLLPQIHRAQKEGRNYRGGDEATFAKGRATAHGGLHIGFEKCPKFSSGYLRRVPGNFI